MAEYKIDALKANVRLHPDNQMLQARLLLRDLSPDEHAVYLTIAYFCSILPEGICEVSEGVLAGSSHLDRVSLRVAIESLIKINAIEDTGEGYRLADLRKRGKPE